MGGHVIGFYDKTSGHLDALAKSKAARFVQEIVPSIHQG